MSQLKKVAMMYDFDNTLIPGYMQNVSFIGELKSSPEEYWTGINNFMLQHNMDSILACMYWPLMLAKKHNIKLTREFFADQGKTISSYFEGVETWFDRINEYGKNLGLEIEHYIISAGIKEILDGCSIAKHFKKIFACTFAFDENGEAFWPSQIVNYTQKTQYMFRVRKNLLENLSDFRDINARVKEKHKLIPYSRLVYFGDGETDVPCMKILKDKRGHSICVYDENNEKAYNEALTIFRDGRVHSMATANYSENSDLDKIVKKILQKIAKTTSTKR